MMRGNPFDEKLARKLWKGKKLQETLVRPMVLGQQRFMVPLLALGMVMPQSCKFLSR